VSITKRKYFLIKIPYQQQSLHTHQQRENIFHSRYLINNKVCILIIDGGSYTEVASKRLVEKLNFPTIFPPKTLQATMVE